MRRSRRISPGEEENTMAEQEKKLGPAPLRITIVSSLFQAFLNLSGLLQNSFSSKRYVLTFE